jgi:hypothetical protein
MPAVVYSASELYQQLRQHIDSFKAIATEVKEVADLVRISRASGMAEAVLAPLVAARYLQIDAQITAICAEANGLNWTHQIVLENGRPAAFDYFTIDDTNGEIEFGSPGGFPSGSFNSGLFADGDYFLPEGFTIDDLTYPDSANIAKTGTDANKIVLTGTGYTTTPDHTVTADAKLTLVAR